MEKVSSSYNSFLSLLLLLSVVGLLIIYLLPHVVLSTGAPVSIVAPSMLAALSAPLIWGMIIKPMRNAALAAMMRSNATLENVVDAVIHFDAGGTVTSLNPAAERIFGYAAAEIVGHHVAELMPHLAKTAPESCQTTACHRNGRSFPADLFVSRIQAGKHSTFVAIVQDISARKAAEQALLESEKRYHSLFRNMLNGFAFCQLLFDEKGEPADYLYLDVNDSFSELTGLEDVVGKKVTEVIPGVENSFAELLQIYARVTMTGEPERFEFYFDWLSRWFFISVFTPEPGHFVVVFENITDRKNAEKEILKAKGDWERTFDAIIDPIMILDTKHKILKANKAMAAELGASQCQMPGSSCCNYLHKMELPPLHCPHSRLLLDGKPHSEEVHDAQGRYYHVVVSPLFGADGELQGSIHFSRNITEQKNLEKQLQHSQKMEAMGTLAGGVAHDFNNILTAIIGYGTLVQMRLPEGDPAQAQVSGLLGAANRATELTRPLLTFSRKEKVELKPANLNEMIHHAEKMLRRLIREDIELRTDLAAGALYVMADKGQIEQVLMNLSINAQDATSGVGTLTIKTERAQLDQEFKRHHGFGEAGKYALLTFSDTGTGIDEETQQRIFEPFFTTKEAGKGTGLGLSIVYGIVKQHTGYITCSSQLGKGTRFQIYIPLTQKRAGVQSSVQDQVIAGGNETILVAEDDEQARQFFRDVLERFGYTVLTACNGEDAVAQFRAHKGEVQLAVLDSVMPKMNGREAFLEMHRDNPGIKALFTSGYPRAKEQMAGAGLAFLPKPILTKDLLIEVRRLLGEPVTSSGS